MHFRYFFLFLAVMMVNSSVGEAQDRGHDMLRAQHTAPSRLMAEQSARSFELAKREIQNSAVHVTMYMTSWCPYCKKARAYLHDLGVELTEYDVDKDAAKKDEMKRLSGGSTAVPVINIEGTVIRGYSPGAIRDAVEDRKIFHNRG